MLGKNRSMDLLDPCAMRMYPCLRLQYGEELNAASNARKEYEQTAQYCMDIWDESNWC